MTIFLIFLISVVVAQFCDGAEANAKRILLNDQSNLQHVVQEMKVEIQELRLAQQQTSKT